MKYRSINFDKLNVDVNEKSTTLEGLVIEK